MSNKQLAMSNKQLAMGKQRFLALNYLPIVYFLLPIVYCLFPIGCSSLLQVYHNYKVVATNFLAERGVNDCIKTVQ